MLKYLVFICLFPFNLLAGSYGDTIRISADLQLIKLKDDCYVHVSWFDYGNGEKYPSNGLVYLNDRKALLFDTPPTEFLTKELITWLTDSLHLTITGFVPNHWHIDCMGGLNYLKSLKIPSYANQLTIDVARKKKLPIPDHGFKDSLELRINDKIASCYYTGAGHTVDNIVVWIPSDKILFAGCMVKDINTNGLGNIADADLKEWPGTIEKLMLKFNNAEIIVPGHGPAGGQELLGHTLTILKNRK